MAVDVGGTGVLVGVAVSVGGTGVSVAVGGTGVLVGVAVSVGGTGVSVAVEVAVGGTGVFVAVAVAVALGAGGHWVVPVIVVSQVPKLFDGSGSVVELDTVAMPVAVSAQEVLTVNENVTVLPAGKFEAEQTTDPVPPTGGGVQVNDEFGVVSEKELNVVAHGTPTVILG